MPASKAQQKAVAKYEAFHYDKFLIRVPKGKKEGIAAHASGLGLSLNAFVFHSISTAMSTDSDIVSADSDVVKGLQDKVKELEALLEAREKRISAFEILVNAPAYTDSDMGTSIDSDMYAPADKLPPPGVSIDSSISSSIDSDTWACLYCGAVIQSKNKLKKFCTDNCRKNHHRKKL